MGQRSNAETVTAILAAFWTHRTWRQAELARTLNLSVRALTRHLEALVGAGWPLSRDEDHPNVFWSLPKAWFPDGILLSREDGASLLHVLLRVPESPERRRLLHAISVRLPVVLQKDAPVARVVPPPATDESEEHLSALLDAALARRPLRLKYFTVSRGSVSDRVVSVQRVVVGPPARFVAWCHASAALKWFRVDSVMRLTTDGAAFHEVEDAAVEALLAGSVDGYSAGPAVRVEVFVREPESRWVRQNLPAGLSARDEPGGVTLFAETAGLLPTARFVVGLGASAVCRTPELAAEVRRLAEGALGRQGG